MTNFGAPGLFPGQARGPRFEALRGRPSPHSQQSKSSWACPWCHSSSRGSEPPLRNPKAGPVSSLCTRTSLMQLGGRTWAHFVNPLSKRPGRDCSSRKGESYDGPLLARSSWPGLRGSSSSSGAPKSPAEPGISAYRNLRTSLGAPATKGEPTTARHMTRP